MSYPFPGASESVCILLPSTQNFKCVVAFIVSIVSAISLLPFLSAHLARRRFLPVCVSSCIVFASVTVAISFSCSLALQPPATVSTDGDAPGQVGSEASDTEDDWDSEAEGMSQDEFYALLLVFLLNFNLMMFSIWLRRN